MKKLLVLLLSVLMILSFSACGSSTTEKTTEKTTEETTSIDDSLTEYDSLKKAESAAGFKFSFNDVIGCGVFYAKEYRAKDGMIEVTYYTEDGKDSDDQYVIRQAKKTDEDISGDTTEYSHDFTVDDAGVKNVRLRGTKNSLYICSFNYEDYSYVIFPGTMDYNETFGIIGEMTGTDPTIYTSSSSQDTEDEDGSGDGAPVIDSDRFIDDDPIDVLEIAGEYSGIDYDKLTLDIYTDTDTTSVGIMTIYNDKGKKVYSGEIQEVATNYYSMTDKDVTITVYTDNGNYGLDLYVDGKQADYFVMTEHYES